MKKFEGKTIVITGAAVGLGYAAAENLASRGANLSLIDYNEETLDEAKQKLSRKYPGVKVLAIVADVSDEEALEYGSDGILTNAIAPGAIMTPMVEEAFRQVNPDNPGEAEKEYASRNPVKRLGTPAEVASVVSFLLSDDNGYLNGQVIAIDGGEANFYGNEKK